VSIAQANVPREAFTEDETVNQICPEFVEYSILMFAIVGLALQVIFFVAPVCQTSPPFGDVTVSARNENCPLVFAIFNDDPASLILILPVDDDKDEGTVQVYVPLVEG